MAKVKGLKGGRAVTKTGKAIWWNLLVRILRSGRFPECKFFKAWIEPHAEFPDDRKKDIGVLFAHNGITGLMVHDHKLFLPTPGIYTLFQNEPILCGDKAKYEKLEHFNPDRMFKQGKGLTLLDDVQVPQIRPTGKKPVMVSLPAEGSGLWAFGMRHEHPSVDAKNLPDIEEWRTLTYEGVTGTVLFETILDDDTHLKYAILPVAI